MWLLLLLFFFVRSIQEKENPQRRTTNPPFYHLFPFFIFFLSFVIKLFFFKKMDSTEAYRFADFCSHDMEEEVRECLSWYPDHYINARFNTWTGLHHACYNGTDARVVRLLLAHPAIEVNALTLQGETSLSLACQSGNTEAVKALLEDQRTDPDIRASGDMTPLHWAIRQGKIEMVEWFIADWRNILPSIISPRVFAMHKNTLSAKVTLLDNFKFYPEKTRWELRHKLGLFDTLAADLFAHILFLCDDFLQLKKQRLEEITTTSTATFVVTLNSNTARFFRIAQQLPMEIQMSLCYASVGGGIDKCYITTQHSEPAFKALAKIYVLQQQQQQAQKS